MKYFIVSSTTLLIAFGVLMLILVKQSSKALQTSQDARRATTTTNQQINDLQETKKQLESFSPQQEKLKAALITEREIPELIQSYASKYGVTASLTTNTTATTALPAHGHRYDIKAEAPSQEALEQFLTTLETSGPLVSVSKAAVTTQSPVTADITLTVYTP